MLDHLEIQPLWLPRTKMYEKFHGGEQNYTELNDNLQV